MSTGFNFSPSTETVEALVDLVAQRVIERGEADNGDGWLRGAERIAAYLDCPPSRVYSLASARRIPVHRDGSNLLARRSELDRWVKNGGGKRP